MLVSLCRRSIAPLFFWKPPRVFSVGSFFLHPITKMLLFSASLTLKVLSKYLLLVNIFISWERQTGRWRELDLGALLLFGLVFKTCRWRPMFALWLTLGPLLWPWKCIYVFIPPALGTFSGVNRFHGTARTVVLLKEGICNKFVQNQLQNKLPE